MKITVFDIDNWKEIGATLARNKTRTFLTAFGIFWGTAMLAMLMGGAKGLEDIISRNFAGFATNSALMFGGRTTMAYKGFNKGTAWELTTDDVEYIKRNIPEIEAITGVVNRSVNASFEKLSTTTTATGVDEYFPKVFLPIIYEGRFINAADTENGRKTCVIGKKVADELFGNESPIGKNIALGGIYYQIVGVAGQTSEITIGAKIDESVLLPLTTMRRAFNMGNTMGGVMFVARDGVAPESLRPRIDRILGSHHPIHPDDHNALFFFDVSSRFKMVDNLFTGISLLAMFVGAGTLLAGIIGVGNIMWVIVKERTQEIGIRRAIGAKPSDIITQVLSEGVMLTVIAGIAGICFATIVLAVAQVLTTDPVSVPRFQLSFSSAMSIMITFIVLGTLAGLIPSIKAMRIKPIEAMNDK